MPHTQTLVLRVGCGPHGDWRVEDVDQHDYLLPWGLHSTIHALSLYGGFLFDLLWLAMMEH